MQAKTGYQHGVDALLMDGGLFLRKLPVNADPADEDADRGLRKETTLWICSSCTTQSRSISQSFHACMRTTSKKVKTKVIVFIFYAVTAGRASLGCAQVAGAGVEARAKTLHTPTAGFHFSVSEAGHLKPTPNVDLARVYFLLIKQAFGACAAQPTSL